MSFYSAKNLFKGDWAIKDQKLPLSPKNDLQSFPLFREIFRGANVWSVLKRQVSILNEETFTLKLVRLFSKLKYKWLKMKSFDCRSKYTKVFQDVPGCCRVFQDVPGWSRVFQGIPRYSRVVQGVPGCSRVFKGVQGCSRVFQGVPGCSRVFQGVPGCFRVFQGVPGYSRVL